MEVFAVHFDKVVAPTFNEDLRSLGMDTAVLSSLISNKEGLEVVRNSLTFFQLSTFLRQRKNAFRCHHILPELAILPYSDSIAKSTEILYALYAARHWVDHAQPENVLSFTMS
jgi:hypothetical protein